MSRRKKKKIGGHRTETAYSMIKRASRCAERANSLNHMIMNDVFIQIHVCQGLRPLGLKINTSRSTGLRYCTLRLMQSDLFLIYIIM